MKLCKDCRWNNSAGPQGEVIGWYTPAIYWRCANPDVAVFSPIDGASETFCDFARKPGGRCTPIAWGFEPHPRPEPKTTPKRRWFQWLTW